MDCNVKALFEILEKRVEDLEVTVRLLSSWVEFERGQCDKDLNFSEVLTFDTVPWTGFSNTAAPAGEKDTRRDGNRRNLPRNVKGLTDSAEGDLKDEDETEQLNGPDLEPDPVGGISKDEVPAATAISSPRRSKRRPPKLEEEPLVKPNSEKKRRGPKRHHPCAHCDATFPGKQAWIKHMKSAHNHRAGWRTCPHCEKRIYNKHKFDIHVRTHTKEKPFLCSTCGTGFPTNSALKSHTSHKHREVETRDFVCKFCGSEFHTKMSCYIHERTHEGKAEKTCPHCERQFVHLKTHINEVHLNLRPFSCHLCDHKFKKNSQLKRHLAAHNNPNRRVKGYHIERSDKKPREGKKLVARINELADEKKLDGGLETAE